MTITPETRLCELFSYPPFAPMRGQFIASESDWLSGGKDLMTLEKLHGLHPTWAVEDMIAGLSRLQRIAEAEKPYVFPLREENPARLIYLPADQKTTGTFCLLLAGGAYGAVCTMVESLPVAAALNSMGMDCFCLNYRTATPDDMVHGLMPKPLEDIALALQLIRKQFTDAPYWMAGFSAGGHACALWGTNHLGAQKYHLPRPDFLLLGYPLISPLSLPAGPVRDYLMQGLFGTGHNRELAEAYSAHLHLDALYPPVFLVKSRDDDTVPARDTESMKKSLEMAGVPHQFEMVSSGGHGFGLGSKTLAAGWVQRSVSWIKTQNK